MKYSKSQIMKSAWALRRRNHVSMSVALKAAWAVVKARIAAEEAGIESGWNYKVSVNMWEKYGMSRSYVSTRIYTNAWNLKREIKIGYVDLSTGAFVAA